MRHHVLLCALVLAGCQPTAQAPPKASASSPAHWLQGSDAQRWETTARQFRGLDQAMVEIGYRYGELAWAGKDHNWDYAAYQLEKIQLALELALERRPKRRASAEVFLRQGLPAMKTVIAQHDAAAFPQALTAFTARCNACHIQEKVGFFTVAPPTQRLSPIVGKP